jgi:hypothetical protein
MRVVIFQYGDYADSYRRLQSGGPETYRHQRQIVDFIASLAPAHDVTTVAVCTRAHNEVLAPGLRSIGLRHDWLWDSRRLWPFLDGLDAQAFICRAPNKVALAWAAVTRVPLLPIFANTVTNTRLRSHLNDRIDAKGAGTWIEAEAITEAKDLPAFINRLRPAVSSLRFHASHGQSLAEQVERQKHGSELCARLSRRSTRASLDTPGAIEWTGLVTRFLNDPAGAREWTKDLAAATNPYPSGQEPTLVLSSATRLSKYARALQNLFLGGPLRPAAT